MLPDSLASCPRCPGGAPSASAVDVGAFVQSRAAATAGAVARRIADVGTGVEGVPGAANGGGPGRWRRPAGRWRRPAAILVAAAFVGTAVPAAHAQWIVPGDRLRVMYGPSAYHFSPSDEHVDHNHLVAAELLTQRWTRWGADRSIVGFAMLDNSFGQFSQYAYVGLEWDLTPLWGGQVFGNVTAGLLHGYKEPYEDKIPFNQLGIAPVIVPTLGWRYGSFSAHVSLLGTNGLMATIGWTFDLQR
jgi:hypothetical protein